MAEDDNAWRQGAPATQDTDDDNEWIDKTSGRQLLRDHANTENSMSSLSSFNEFICHSSFVSLNEADVFEDTCKRNTSSLLAQLFLQQEDSETTIAHDNSSLGSLWMHSSGGGDSFSCDVSTSNHESETSFSVLSLLKHDEDPSPIQLDNKSVRFGNVSVREYPVTMGLSMNSIACPLELSWDYKEKNWEDIKSYVRSTDRGCLGESWALKPNWVSLDERRQWVASSLNIRLSKVRLLEQQQETNLVGKEDQDSDSCMTKSSSSSLLAKRLCLVSDKETSRHRQADIPPRKPEASSY